MQYLIYFVVFFVMIYLLYYFLYVRKRVVYDEKNLSSDIKILRFYYGVDIQKIGYSRVLRILNFVNACMLSGLMLIVININKYIYKLLVLIVLITPAIWVIYYFLAKYLKFLEGKSEKDV